MSAREHQADDLELAKAMLDRLTQLFDDDLTPAHVVEKLPGRIKELRDDIRALEALAAEAKNNVVPWSPGSRGELSPGEDKAAMFRTIMGEVADG